MLPTKTFNTLISWPQINVYSEFNSNLKALFFHLIGDIMKVIHSKHSTYLACSNKSVMFMGRSG